MCQKLPSYLSLNRIILHVYRPHFVYQCIGQMGTWVASILWVLWVTLLWAWRHKYLFESLPSVLWNIPGSGIPGSYSHFSFKILRNYHSAILCYRVLQRNTTKRLYVHYIYFLYFSIYLSSMATDLWEEVSPHEDGDWHVPRSAVSKLENHEN